MASISYRRFSGADWESVFLFLDAEDQSVEHPLDVLAHHPVEAWLALDDDDCIGWILTRGAMSDDGLDRGFIEDLVVAGNYRGQGIARHLVELAEDHYREREFSGMQLTVRADNQAAGHLYRSMGYETRTGARTDVEGFLPGCNERPQALSAWCCGPSCRSEPSKQGR